MDGTRSDERAYAIEVSALPDAAGVGFAGRVVVRRLPERCAVLCEEVLACGRLWSRQRNALAAAYARGRQFVHFELCRELADRWPGKEPDEPPAWPPGDEHELGPFEVTPNCELQSPLWI